LRSVNELAAEMEKAEEDQSGDEENHEEESSIEDDDDAKSKRKVTLTWLFYCACLLLQIAEGFTL
jgi:hypothetical protein